MEHEFEKQMKSNRWQVFKYQWWIAMTKMEKWEKKTSFR